MKTPSEIKKGLECCACQDGDDCSDMCPYSGRCDIDPYALERDALTYIQQLERQPSIDAVEVVRCKDCKHSEAVSWAGKGFVQCLYHSHAVSEKGYCYKGERKEDDH